MLLCASALDHVSFSDGRFKALPSRRSRRFFCRASCDPVRFFPFFNLRPGDAAPTRQVALRGKDKDAAPLRILVLFKRSVEDEADLAWRSNFQPARRRQVLTQPRGPIHSKKEEGPFFPPTTK